MDHANVIKLLSAMGYSGNPISIEPFLNEEDGQEYQVWLLLLPEGIRVLKAAKGVETEIYTKIFTKPHGFAPRLFGTAHTDGRDYLLMEYISGENLIRCDRTKLTAALDSLIQMQSLFWQNQEFSQTGRSFAESLPGRENRLNYLKDPQLEQIYREFLAEYRSVPRTLCHDDLLPFNVIVSKDRAVFIDWEYGGILPYPVSLARLIAHGKEGEGAFFYMTEEDKAFALDYYYQNFITDKAIPREAYERTMALFLFYEYCEWIYLRNRYPDADPVRYRSYLEKAKALAAKLIRAN